MASFFLEEMNMNTDVDINPIELVKSYFAALDSSDMSRAGNYLSDQYQMVDFLTQPLDQAGMLDLLRLLKVAMPNLQHSLSNIRMEENVVKLTVQLSGTNSGHLDLRSLGIGVVPRSQKFLIFPNADYEISVRNGKITTERDVSPPSQFRRMSGMLKTFGVNMAAL